ncbi:MAG TPA: phage baseplate assembly protein V [Pseudomonas sp.]|nr:phage baseplate assembly protein V [Pseudomonas sp.]HWH86362.1 phage baseplate assembly protein V [Pseudomonas sp.]
MLARSVVSLVDDTSKMQTLQMKVYAEDLGGGVEHWQGYGMTSVPHPGAEGLLACIGGHREHSVVIACADRRYRLTGLASGEVALYTDEGDRIHFKRGRIIDINTGTLNINASVAVNIDTPTINQSGAITAQGDVVGAGVSLSTHPHGGVEGGSDQTSAPIPGAE